MKYSGLCLAGILLISTGWRAMPALAEPSTSVPLEAAGASAANTTSTVSVRWTEKPEWEKHFAAAGVQNGTFLLFDPGAKEYRVYNRPRATTPFLPASTYKILNSLIALETGAVRDENEVIPWDGVKRMADWNKDHNMRTAFAASVVPFYQEVARRIGPERMQHYVNLVNYGNRDLGGGIDQFWLTGALRITAEQEIDLLLRLHRNQLPFSQRTVDIVKDIMIREKTPAWTLRGKTGWAFDVKPRIGWFVGYLERADGKGPFFFALNMDMELEKDAPARLAITKAILKEEGVI